MPSLGDKLIALSAGLYCLAFVISGIRYSRKDDMSWTEAILVGSFFGLSIGLWLGLLAWALVALITFLSL
jgi:hypothetical protein